MARGRRSIVNPKGPQKMYVVAGLPKSVHKSTLNALQQRYRHHIFKGIPSSSTDGVLYPEQLIDGLIRSIGEFVVRKRKHDKDHPTPASITLLFVPAPDQEKLLSTFDFALMTAPLYSLTALESSHRQQRHDREAVLAALGNAVAKNSKPNQNLAEVARRLAYQSDNEALLLPPKNFFTEDGCLVSLFRQFRLGKRKWADRFPELGPTPLTRGDVPKRIKPNQTRRVFVDVRDIAFFIAHPTAYDGSQREVEDKKNRNEILSALRSLYRFGGALAPGLHHDAQRRDGTALGGASFDCSSKGRINAASGYVNVYPNDFVRVEKYKQSK